MMFKSEILLFTIAFILNYSAGHSQEILIDGSLECWVATTKTPCKWVPCSKPYKYYDTNFSEPYLTEKAFAGGRYYGFRATKLDIPPDPLLSHWSTNIYQILKEDIVPGEQYIFSFACRMPDSTLTLDGITYQDPANIRFFLGTSKCAKEYNIIEINDFSKKQWTVFETQFSVNNNYSYILLDISPPEGLTSDFATYTLIDAMSLIKIHNSEPQCNIFFPNSFSPNNDGINDFFRPQFNEGDCILDNYILDIFDRWGNK